MSETISDEEDTDFKGELVCETSQESIIKTRNQRKNEEHDFKIVSDEKTEKRKLTEEIWKKMNERSKKVSKINPETNKINTSVNFKPEKSNTITVENEASKLARELLKPVEKSEKTVKFAGELIKYQFKNMTRVTGKEKKPETGIEKLLKSLSTTKTISAIEKTNYDWEKYKTKEGIKDELERKAKNGYIEKQEFLKRVDYRRFEQERDQRERERIQRQLKEAK